MENPTDENSVRTGAQVTLVGATVPKDLENILADKLPVLIQALIGVCYHFAF